MSPGAVLFAGMAYGLKESRPVWSVSHSVFTSASQGTVLVLEIVDVAYPWDSVLYISTSTLKSNAPLLKKPPFMHWCVYHAPLEGSKGRYLFMETSVVSPMQLMTLSPIAFISWSLLSAFTSDPLRFTPCLSLNWLLHHLSDKMLSASQIFWSFCVHSGQIFNDDQMDQELICRLEEAHNLISKYRQGGMPLLPFR